MAKKFTIGDLMNVDQGRQEKAAMSVVSLEKTFHELKPESLLDKFKALFGGKNTVKEYNVIFKFKVTSNTGNVHTVFIKTSPDFNLKRWVNNKVEVYCDCSDFKYRSAYALGQHGSLFLTDRTKTALGAAVNDAPKGKAGATILCKHAYAALSWLIDNYANVMKTI